MNEEVTRMKPIWYFVGWVLIVIGVLVFAAGIYYFYVPIKFNVELRGMHIGIWWGLVLVLGGALLTYFNRKPVNA